MGSWTHWSKFDGFSGTHGTHIHCHCCILQNYNKSTLADVHPLITGAAVETEQKYGAGQNKHTATTLNTTKLDRETEELKHDKLDMKVGLLIQKGRQAKGLSQKELATKICEKPQVVNEYESSKAVPNQAILGKLERALEIKLRGKDKGAPLAPKAKKAGAK